MLWAVQGRRRIAAQLAQGTDRHFSLSLGSHLSSLGKSFPVGAGAGETPFAASSHRDGWEGGGP